MSEACETEVMKWCKKYIETEFAPCGLKGDVERRIYELCQEWRSRKAQGKLKTGKKAIFIDLHRAVWKAEADSKKYGKDKCKYYSKWLRLPFTQPGGLGYWTLKMWG